MKYLILDSANTFFRAIHATSAANTPEEKAAFSLHVTLTSILSSWNLISADHMVACFDGRSWRKDFYKPYKANRAISRQAASEQEKLEMTACFSALDALHAFFANDTNVTTLQNESLEADDLIAGWIQHHPHDEHVIISSDGDYYQLLSESVKQYNGISNELHTIHGIYGKNNKLVIDKKTKKPKATPDPKFLLFEKCVRGDAGDNVFSAYPGVRLKGTKNKTGILDAYSDIDKKGFYWNNFMLSRWVDHDNIEHRVIDDYERNKTLIDLSAQPTHIRDRIDNIVQSVISKDVNCVGARFLKFCGMHDLVRIKERAAEYSNILNKKYIKSN